MSAERCSPSVRVDHIHLFATVTELIAQGKTDEAFAAFKANIVEFQNFGGALNAGLPQNNWPNPPGAPVVLDTHQKHDMLFPIECGLSNDLAPFVASLPEQYRDDATINIYKQFYGPGSGGWAECSYWYANRGAR